MISQDQEKKLRIKYIADTLFLGMVCFELTLTSLSVHWQYDWSYSFKNLEKTRILKYRLERAIIALEQYHLKREKNASNLIKTNIDTLVSIPDFRVVKIKEYRRLINRMKYFVNSMRTGSIQEGY